jgi:hypothetical protein
MQAMQTVMGLYQMVAKRMYQIMLIIAVVAALFAMYRMEYPDVQEVPVQLPPATQAMGTVMD